MTCLFWRWCFYLHSLLDCLHYPSILFSSPVTLIIFWYDQPNVLLSVSSDLVSSDSVSSDSIVSILSSMADNHPDRSHSVTSFDCPICLEVLNDPVKSSFCLVPHHFCRGCINDYLACSSLQKKCPICCHFISNKIVDAEVEFKERMKKELIKCSVCHRFIYRSHVEEHRLSHISPSTIVSNRPRTEDDLGTNRKAFFAILSLIVLNTIILFAILFALNKITN